MTLQYIDIVGIQALQAILYRIEDVLPREASLIGKSSLVQFCSCTRWSLASDLTGLDRHADLRENNDIRSRDIEFLYRLAEHDFGEAVGIHTRVIVIL